MKEQRSAEHENGRAQNGGGCCREPSPPGPTRRGFLGRVVAGACGLIALAVPTAAGVVAFLNPLRQKSRSGALVRLTSLDMVPEDGTPKKFPIIADHTDAWTQFPAEPIGAVFLRRVGGSRLPAGGTAAPEVVAFQVVCPHAGCSIDFEQSSAGGKFFCPCHSASFDLSGKRIDATSPSPRDMDSLAVEIRNQNEVWVRFETFTVGTARKVAQS